MSSLFRIFDVVGSALSAQTTRLNVTASNLANADTVASTPEGAYHAREPVFATILDQTDGAVNGVQVLGITQSSADIAKRYEPGHPMADNEGYVYGSNVSPIEEMVNMLSASRSYQNGIEVLNTSKEMLMRTLNLGR
jgi:flagellar basal-body rod protein FlgC